MEKTEIIKDLQLIKSYCGELETRKNIETLISKLSVIKGKNVVLSGNGRVLATAKSADITITK